MVTARLTEAGCKEGAMGCTDGLGNGIALRANDRETSESEEFSLGAQD
jgi:hypothetical protein